MKRIEYSTEKFSIGVDNYNEYVYQCNYCGQEYNTIFRNVFKNGMIHYALICVKCNTNDNGSLVKQPFERHLGYISSEYSKNFKIEDRKTNRFIKKELKGAKNDGKRF